MPTIREQLADAKERFAAAETIEDAESIKSEVDQLIKQVAEADKKGNLMDSTKTDAPIVTEKGMSLGQFAAANIDASALREKAGVASATMGAKAATDVSLKPTITTISQDIIQPTHELLVRDIIGTENISGNSLSYFVMGAVDGTMGVVAENAKKVQVHPNYTQKTEALTKIASYFKETEELLDDAQFLASALDNRGIYAHETAVDAYIASTILGTSGIQTATGTNAEAVLDASMAVHNATGIAADAVVINPADYATFRKAKDSNLQYYGGGYFYAPYGNGSVTEQPGLWGLRTVVSSAVAQGTILVGAFRQGAALVGKAGEGVRVEVANTNEDDFIYNRVTVRIEERLLCAVRMPAAFCKVTISNS